MIDASVIEKIVGDMSVVDSLADTVTLADSLDLACDQDGDDLAPSARAGIANLISCPTMDRWRSVRHLVVSTMLEGPITLTQAVALFAGYDTTSVQPPTSEQVRAALDVAVNNA